MTNPQKRRNHSLLNTTNRNSNGRQYIQPQQNESTSNTNGRSNNQPQQYEPLLAYNKQKQQWATIQQYEPFL